MNFAFCVGFPKQTSGCHTEDPTTKLPEGTSVRLCRLSLRISCVVGSIRFKDGVPILGPGSQEPLLPFKSGSFRHGKSKIKRHADAPHTCHFFGVHARHGKAATPCWCGEATEEEEEDHWGGWEGGKACTDYTG